MKTAVIYHYYELNEDYKENFIFFLAKAILPELRYFVYISGECSFELPQEENIKYYFIENKNHDFGSAVEFSRNSEACNFDYYIYINSSVRGPFSVEYYNNKWHDIFLSKFSGRIGIVGSSINILPENTINSKNYSDIFEFDSPYIHVQTTSYALNREAFDLLREKGFYNEDRVLGKLEVISRYEIHLSQILINNGFEISSILPLYEKFSSSIRKIDIKGTSRNGDLLWKLAYFGRTVSPHEIVFIKTNRNLISRKELASHTFTSIVGVEKSGKFDLEIKKLFLKSYGISITSDSEEVNLSVGDLKSLLYKLKRYNPLLASELKSLL